MGLDDFASAEELEALQGTAPTTGLDPQDEDLFDFPDMTLRAGSPASAPKAEAAAKAEPAPRAEAAEQAGKAEQAQVAEQAPPATKPKAPAAPAYDPALDEDIFNFGELFTPAESRAGEDMIPATDLFQPASDGTDPFAASEAAEVEEEQEVAPEAPEPVRSAPRAPARARSRVELAPVLVPELTEDENPLRNRMVLFFLVGFLVVNGAVMLFAWKASRSFETAMSAMRDQIDREPRVVTVPQPVAAPVQPSEEAPQPAPGARSYEDAELMLAREELAEGMHAAARRRLFRLLANRDRIALGSEEVATAEYLIARTFLEEAEATPSTAHLQANQEVAR